MQGAQRITTLGQKTPSHVNWTSYLNPKSFSIMCKFAHVKKFKVVSLHWNLNVLY